MASFDERAATWDDDEKVQRAEQSATNIADHVSLQGTERLFEYGAGTGLVSQALRARVGPVTLADTSEGMRRELQKKVADGRLAGAHIWDLDLSDGVAPDNAEFDLIVTSMVLHHVDRVDETLQAFRELLAVEGHLCVIDLDAEDGSFHGEGVHVHHGFDRTSLVEQVRSCGFADVNVFDNGAVHQGDETYSLFLIVAH